ncbi:MAG: hypothetical protein KGI97_07655 [Alphaproteobacteria bacterium]|nr:hypothetical protein [Alphaproteobacteria bacterium]
MANWLQKKPSLPAQRKTGNLPAQPGRPPQHQNANLPNATVIYGIGASFLFVAAFFLAVSGRWFPAIAVFAIGACLVGFALHLLKHQD